MSSLCVKTDNEEGNAEKLNKLFQIFKVINLRFDIFAVCKN